MITLGPDRELDGVLDAPGAFSWWYVDTVDASGNRIDRRAEHGRTGVLTMKGYIIGKPGLPHYNYAARVMTGFMGRVFEVPQAALDARATATATSLKQAFTTPAMVSCSAGAPPR